jgi:hypothetical protein
MMRTHCGTCASAACHPELMQFYAAALWRESECRLVRGAHPVVGGREPTVGVASRTLPVRLASPVELVGGR